VAGSIDLLKLAVGAVRVAGVGLFLWGWRDVRDVFEEAFGDVPMMPEGVKIGGQQEPGGDAGIGPATDNQREIAPHGEGV
jgi:hypothetical protein